MYKLNLLENKNILLEEILKVGVEVTWFNNLIFEIKLLNYNNFIDFFLSTIKFDDDKFEIEVFKNNFSPDLYIFPQSLSQIPISKITIKGMNLGKFPPFFNGGILETLELINCKIDFGYTLNLPKLRNLRLEGKMIGFVCDFFFPNIQKIQLSNLSTIPTSIFNGSSIKQIQISKCNLDYLNLPTLHSLEYLELDSNNLTKIPNFVFKQYNIKILNLRYNEISEVILKGELKNLLNLNLNTNKIESKKIKLTNSNNLEIINLDNNQLDCIPETIFKIDSIKKIFVENNKIQDLNRINNNLEILDISKNPLEKIEQIPSCNSNLKLIVSHDVYNHIISLKGGKIKIMKRIL